jgi:hypothetical protein
VKLKRTVPIILAAALATPAAASAGINAGTETVTSGAVTATLSWDAGETQQNTKMTISRGGAVVYQQLVPRICGTDCLIFTDDDDSLQAADLDGDGDPELVVKSANFDGDQCCDTMGVFQFNPGTGTYDQFVKVWPSSVEIKRSGGVTRLVGEDGRFDSIVPDAVYAPIRVYKFQRGAKGGEFVDVTRDSPKLVAADARGNLSYLDEFRHDVDIARALIGSYVADEYVLGKGSQGLKQLDKRLKKGIFGKATPAKAFRKRLVTGLKRLGYA